RQGFPFWSRGCVSRPIAWDVQIPVQRPVLRLRESCDAELARNGSFSRITVLLMGANDEKEVKSDAPKKPAETRVEFAKAIAVPLFTALLGVAVTLSLNLQQERDAKLRFYAEMMGRREESDTSLRKDMLQAVMNRVLQRDSKAPAVQDEKFLDQQ